MFYFYVLHVESDNSNSCPALPEAWVPMGAGDGLFGLLPFPTWVPAKGNARVYPLGVEIHSSVPFFCSGNSGNKTKSVFFMCYR